jgi:hypothetical protein
VKESISAWDAVIIGRDPTGLLAARRISGEGLCPTGVPPGIATGRAGRELLIALRAGTRGERKA